MKKKTKELRAVSSAELEEKLVQLRETLAKEKAMIASGTRPEKPAKIRNAKRDIARILTITTERSKKGGN